MRDIRHIKAAHAAILAEQRALLDKGTLTASDRKQYDQCASQLLGIKAELATAVAAQDAEKSEAARLFAGGSVDPNQAASQTGLAAAGLSSTSGHATAPTRPSGRRFADLFPTAAGQMDRWGSAGEYLAVVGHGLHDSRLRADSMQGGQGSSGGFAVPTQLLGSWLDASLESEIVRARATTWAMTSSTLDVPALDDLDRSGGDTAGMTLRFEGELATMSPQAARLRKLRLHARRGAILLEASNDLVSDAPSFEANISGAMIRALGFGLDEKFLFGDGSGGPLGALVSPAAIIVAKEAGQTAATILYENLLAMFARLAPGAVARSVWIANPSTIPQLASLSLTLGTAGSHVPVMTSADGAFTILTRPVIFTEKAKTLGAQSDISLADFSAYAIGLRKEATLDKSQHVGFARDVETYRLQIRVDGQPTISGPITPLNGPTMSPFVTLAERV